MDGGYRDDIAECVNEAMKVSELIYRAGLLGKLSDMDARDKASALEIVRRHQNNSARKSTSDSFSEIISATFIIVRYPRLQKRGFPNSTRSAINFTESSSS